MPDNPAIQALPPEASAQELLDLPDEKWSQMLGFPPEPAPVAEEGKGTSAADAASEAPAPVAETPAAEAPTEVVAPPTEGEEPAPVEGEAVEEVVEEKPPEPPKPLLTKFQVFDKEGEVEVPELLFSFEADGKRHEDVPLDKVVLLAQMGVYNHRKQQETNQRLAEANSALQERDQKNQLVQQYEKYMVQLLEDPEFLDAARQDYLQSQTPEAALKREKAQIEAERQQLAQQREGMAVEGFVKGYLSPRLTSLMAENPSVTEAEVVGLYTQLTAPLLVRGRLPVERFAEVQALVERDLAYQVKGIHAERAEAKATESKTLKAEQTKAQAAKRQLARAAAPRTAAPPSAPKPPKFDSAQDWLKATFPEAE